MHARSFLTLSENASEAASLAASLASLAASPVSPDSLVDFADEISRKHGDAMHALIEATPPDDPEAAYLAKWAYRESAQQFSFSVIRPSKSERWEYDPYLAERLNIPFSHQADRFSDLVRKSGGIGLSRRGNPHAFVGGMWWSYSLQPPDYGRLVSARPASPVLSPDDAFGAAVSLALSSGIVRKNLDVSAWR